MSDALPETEARDAGGSLDTLETLALVERLANAQRRASEAVVERSAAIAAIVDEVVRRLRLGGRLHYVGAGTSGRLAVLDAAEMGPTFGSPPERVCAHIAGGERALLSAVEGAEDDADSGESAMRDHVGAGDAVIGISASGSARFVVAAVEASRACGAFAACIVNSRDSTLEAAADAAIVLSTGAEPLAGSTRMKAGTAQKIALNTISTAVMVRLGHVYDNLMVDVVASNAKLRARARRLVQTLTGVDDDAAAALLEAAEGSVKVAAVMKRRECDAASARVLLEQNGGNLRAALG